MAIEFQYCLVRRMKQHSAIIDFAFLHFRLFVDAFFGRVSLFHVLVTHAVMGSMFRYTAIAC